MNIYQNTTTIDVGGAQLTVATKDLFRAWLEKNLGIPHSTDRQLVLPLAAEGERYAGTIICADGTGHHIFRLPLERGKKMKWAKALDYAKEHGAELPDRVEGALLFATREEGEFEAAWYWTREQHAGRDDCAWCQYFGNGSQNGSHKDYDFRAVLARRVAFSAPWGGV